MKTGGKVRKKLFNEKFTLRPKVHRRLKSVDVVKDFKKQQKKKMYTEVKKRTDC